MMMTPAENDKLIELMMRAEAIGNNIYVYDPKLRKEVANMQEKRYPRNARYGYFRSRKVGCYTIENALDQKRHHSSSGLRWKFDLPGGIKNLEKFVAHDEAIYANFMRNNK